MKCLKIWTNFKQVVTRLDEAEIGRLFLMMLDYAETGEEPDEFIGNEAFIWGTAKRDIDMVEQRNETNRSNGAKGGRPKTEENRTEPNETVGYEEKPNITEHNRKPLIEKKRKEIEEKVIEKESNKEKPSRFSPPSVDEVRAYCQERGNKVDPEAFVAFYESKGWKIGNTPMKSWKASVITWEKREQAAPTKTVIAQQYEQRDYSGVQEAVSNDYAGEIERRLREKNRKKVLAQMYDQRDYSGVQDELMEQQDRDMEEFLRKEKEKGANNNAESNSTADVLPDDSEWLFNGTS